MTVKLCIFDLDGVICDTAKYHFIAWKNLANRLGINFTEEDNERLKGVSRMDSLEILLSLGEAKYTDEEKIKFSNEKNNEYVKLISNMTRDEVLPGVIDFITELKNRGIKIALGSVSKNAQTILERLELTNYFDSIIDGNKVTKAKPDPEVFLNAAKELNIDTSECIVFEDAFEGIKAALAANMKCVGIGDEKILNKANIVISGFDCVTVDAIFNKLM